MRENAPTINAKARDSYRVIYVLYDTQIHIIGRIIVWYKLARVCILAILVPMECTLITFVPLM